ncbi:ubiquitin carboxyl-terminal hydrolase 45 [Lepeophtheirus salmonis]|uniref:ubiquitin carboxyl-terminal hydrolase 45 n=1 Tax=Lepeophtheirus salmonis TaxID=72036 RepID=UPI001AE34673|nr:ubiquitin carboxyl-terminal hydrolase 16-like [Lepeophtheirus salmonis]XP_040571684.1 ubiquitin carboxyl-terminal hydrolase 16-like [Lepeophtheirus salmonis]
MGSGRKRSKQRGPYEEEDRSCSTPSDLENEESLMEEVKCTHAAACVSERKVRKALSPSFVQIGGSCSECKRLKSIPKKNDPFWMCLDCGRQFCSEHKTTHFEAPRSEHPHCIALDLEEWIISCTLCQISNLSPDTSKKLRDVFERVKHIKANKKKTPVAQSNPSSTLPTKLPKVRGLSNLGNTCFFNAVMQCLTQSHPLLHILDLHSQKGAPFKTGKLLDGESLNLQLEDSGPLTLSLAAFLKEMNSMGGKSGAYNPSQLFGRISHRSPQFRGFHQEDSHELLRHLMEGVKTEEVNRQKTSVLKHYGLTDKASRVSLHEKTRKRLQSCNRYTNHTIVDQLFGGHLVSTILCEVCHNSSQIFEPFLDISLPLIEEKPTRPNKFDDDETKSSLSCFGSKKGNNETGPRNKFQLKKEKRNAKKEMRKNKKKNKTIALEEIEEKIDEEKPDVSINIKENEDVVAINVNGELDEAVNTADTVVSEHTEIVPLDKKNVGKNSQNIITTLNDEGKQSNASKLRPKDGNEEDDEDDDASANDDDWEWYTDTQDEKTSTDQGEEVVNLDDKVSGNVNASESVCDINSCEPHIREDSGDSSNADVEDNIDFNHPRANTNYRSFSICQDSYNPDSLHLDPRMQELSRNVRRLSVQASAFEDISDRMQQEYTVTYDDNGNEIENEDFQVQNDWIARSLTSIAPRYTSRSPGECSIYSCLAQFTSPELLTGNNKWACDKCTLNQSERKKNRNERNSSSPEQDSSSDPDAPKTVYSNASKQLSIFSPPFILTLHLKRFQQTMCSLKKINKHVDFPLVLDLAPFCSSAAVSTSTVEAGQESVKYYLFGLISHSGRLHGGHYTAYVRVRPRDCSKDFSRFYSTCAVKNDEINDLLEEIERKFKEYSKKMSQNIYISDSEETNDAPDSKDGPMEPCKWYHVSDSVVTEVSEEKVLKSQAYILFYERFL